MSKSRKPTPKTNKPKGKATTRPAPAPPVQKPEKRRFGTNPAQGESHVHVPPELMGPAGGEGGFLDDFQQTMYA